MRKLCALIAVILITSVLCTACQPTPENPAVVSKNDGALEQAIANGAPNGYVFEAPKSHEQTDSLLDGKINVTIDKDTEIKAAKGVKYPVYEATISTFDSDTVRRIADVFFGDTPMERHLSEEARRTKSSILNDEILPKKVELADLENGYTDKYISQDEKGVYIILPSGEKAYNDSVKTIEEAIADEIDALKFHISELEKEYKSAPETVETTPISLDEYEKGKSFNADVPTPDGRFGRLCVNSTGTILTATYNYEEALDTDTNEFYGGVEGSVYILFNSPDELPIEDEYTIYDVLPTLDYEKSKAAAIDFVEQLGLSDYSYAGIGVGSMGCDGDYSGPLDKLTYTKYGVIFTRKVGDLVCLPDEELYMKNKANGKVYDENGEVTEHSEPFYYEKLVVWVGVDGVESIYWSSPLKIEQELQSSVELVDFERVAQTAVDNARRQGYFSEDLLIRRNTYFSKFELGYAMMKEKNKMDCFLLIPAWVATYYVDYEEYEDETKDNIISAGKMSQTYMVNAVDGSLINRGLGY